MGRAKGQNNAIDVSAFNDVFGRTRGSTNFRALEWNTLLSQTREKFTGYLLDEAMERLTRNDITGEQFSDFLRVLENHDNASDIKIQLTQTVLEFFVARRVLDSEHGLQHALIAMRLLPAERMTIANALTEATRPGTPNSIDVALSLFSQRNRNDLIMLLKEGRRSTAPRLFLDYHIKNMSPQQRKDGWKFIAELRKDSRAFSNSGGDVFRALYNAEVTKDQFNHLDAELAESFAEIVQNDSDASLHFSDFSYNVLAISIAEAIHSLREKGRQQEASQMRLAVSKVLRGDAYDKDMSNELKGLMNQCGVNASLVLEDNFKQALNQLGIEFNENDYDTKQMTSSVISAYKSVPQDKEENVARNLSRVVPAHIASAVLEALSSDADPVTPSHPLYRFTAAGGSVVDWSMHSNAIEQAAAQMLISFQPRSMDEVVFDSAPMLKLLSDLAE